MNPLAGAMLVSLAVSCLSVTTTISLGVQNANESLSYSLCGFSSVQTVTFFFVNKGDPLGHKISVRLLKLRLRTEEWRVNYHIACQVILLW